MKWIEKNSLHCTRTANRDEIFEQITSSPNKVRTCRFRDEHEFANSETTQNNRNTIKHKREPKNRNKTAEAKTKTNN